ncbi:MAG: hypothetical protein GX387_11950, partial [Clostridium sp.]|nr:hypothetical protein [Clostridium sp.]
LIKYTLITHKYYGKEGDEKQRMSYKVTVGNAVLEKCIESVQFNVSTLSDYIFTSRCNNKNLIKVTGNIDTEESTVVLCEWALLPATNPECYKEITIEHYKEEKLLIQNIKMCDIITIGGVNMNSKKIKKILHLRLDLVSC